MPAYIVAFAKNLTIAYTVVPSAVELLTFQEALIRTQSSNYSEDDRLGLWHFSSLVEHVGLPGKHDYWH